jgi:hypothetical protein
MQVRVLCAIGTYTNRLGGNVWASVSTLAKSCNLNPRSVQRAMPVLIERGYLRRMIRPGRTTLYEVVLQIGAPLGAVTQESLGGDYAVTTPPTQESLKREKERSNKTNTDSVALKSLLDSLWNVYPKRLTPHGYIPVRAQVDKLLSDGISPERILRSAQMYGEYTVRESLDLRFIKSMHGFYMDDYWRAYDVQTVNGRTREQWARSGQDVSEFDRQIARQSGAEDMTAADVLFGGML